MEFVEDDKAAAAQAVAQAICDGLASDKRVLWLVSGGSNIAVEKQVMDLLRDHAAGSLDKLAIIPVDERYGAPGHEDSNVRQLRAAGFDAGGATLVDVLVHGTPFEQTVSFYTDVMAAALSNAGLVVAQLGMGPDGHIAGIKPRSPAAEADESTVAGYKWDDYERLTLMPAALRQADKAFLLAYGTDKKPMLQKLYEQSADFKDLPAMLLYELPDVTVYSDYVAGSRRSHPKESSHKKGGTK